MGTDIRNLIILLFVGLVPCALAGGFSQYGDAHALPWLLGFGAQAIYVGGAMAWRRLARRNARRSADGMLYVTEYE